MEHTEAWNLKLKKSGRAFQEEQTSENRERLLAVLEECHREIAQSGEFLPWFEAVLYLELPPVWQMLLCVMWESETRGKRIDIVEFQQLYCGIFRQELYSINGLPAWIYESEGRIILSPVLLGWLEGQNPILPTGAELILTKEKKAWGMEQLLLESEILMDRKGRTEESAILCVEGEEGSGRQFCMEQISARQGMALLLLDGDAFRGTEREMNACVLCAGLFGAFLCVRLGKEVRSKLLQELSECFSFYGVIKDNKRMLEEHPSAVVYIRQIPRPDKACKQQMAEVLLGEWVSHLPEKCQMQQLIGRQLPIGAFWRYIRNVRAELDAGTSQLEQVLTPSVSTSLNFLPATRTFAELKLPKTQYDQLRQISSMIAAREEVMGQWGFGDKFSYGNGMSVLFYGAPGTGKTMAAQVLANELGMPLYRVDLSQLISKYIGETQKNIGRIFDEADKCDCILLFDEADAIFAKRSDVSDAQDRYSNAETAYLLQRIEQYAGVSILATNLLQNFDEAFRRRISYMVHFPMPDEKLRKELWDTIFPTATPISDEVDTLMLAQAFELSGASIKNAALHSALMARAEGSQVRMKHILSGISNEYGKQGKVLGPSQKELFDAFL